MEISNKEGMKEIFTRFIRKNGKIIYPKNSRYFHFWVPVDGYRELNCKQLSMFDKDKE